MIALSAFKSSLLALLLASSSLAVITGERKCIDNFGCFAALVDSDTSLANYTMEVSAQLNGWFAIGTGGEMAGSDMLVAWENAGSIITSQRSARGEVMPTTAAVIAEAFQSVSSTIGDVISVSWISSFPLTVSAETEYIWATRSGDNPGSDPNGRMQAHRSGERDHFTMNLLATYDPNAATTTATEVLPSGRGSSGNRNLSEASVRVQLAHVIVLFLAFLLFFPAGALIARYGRTYTHKWFSAHKYVQLFAVILVIIGFALGVSWISERGRDHFQSTHAKLGLALFILVIVQTLLGEFAHQIMARKGVRTGYVHAVIGVTTFGLSIWEIQLGLDLWSWNPSNGVSIFVYVWTVVIGLSYIAGFALIPRERRQAKERLSEKEGSYSSEEALRSGSGSA